MTLSFRNRKPSLLKKAVIFCILIAFLSNTVFFPIKSYAQPAAMGLPYLPPVGTMVSLSPSYMPVMLKGLKLNPSNPLAFDFILDTGDTKLGKDALKEESTKLIKYFLASLTTPGKDLWVNLSPYEKNRVIPKDFGVTQMGQDLLAQDYILKQLTASLIYPENELGKKFWEKTYKKAQELYGTTEIPVNTFNKVWIVPDKATIYVNNNTAFIVKTHMKVMLEEDYLALSETKDQRLKTQDQKQVSALSSQVIREVILPEIEKEVNAGKNFANLRQITDALILAIWFKRNLKDNILSKVYSDQNKTSGVDSPNKDVKEKIYQQYVEAFKKGTYNYIKEDINPTTKEAVPRRYIAGGYSIDEEHVLIEAASDSALLADVKSETLIKAPTNITAVNNNTPQSKDSDSALLTDDKKDIPEDTIDGILSNPHRSIAEKILLAQAGKNIFSDGTFTDYEKALQKHGENVKQWGKSKDAENKLYREIKEIDFENMAFDEKDMIIGNTDIYEKNIEGYFYRLDKLSDPDVKKKTAQARTALANLKEGLRKGEITHFSIGLKFSDYGRKIKILHGRLRDLTDLTSKFIKAENDTFDARMRKYFSLQEVESLEKQISKKFREQKLDISLITQGLSQVEKSKTVAVTNAQREFSTGQPVPPLAPITQSDNKTKNTSNDLSLIEKTFQKIPLFKTAMLASITGLIAISIWIYTLSLPKTPDAGYAYEYVSQSSSRSMLKLGGAGQSKDGWATLSSSTKTILPQGDGKINRLLENISGDNEKNPVIAEVIKGQIGSSVNFYSQLFTAMDEEGKFYSTGVSINDVAVDSTTALTLKAKIPALKKGKRVSLLKKMGTVIRNIRGDNGKLILRGENEAEATQDISQPIFITYDLLEIKDKAGYYKALMPITEHMQKEFDELKTNPDLKDIKSRLDKAKDATLEVKIQTAIDILHEDAIYNKFFDSRLHKGGTYFGWMASVLKEGEKFRGDCDIFSALSWLLFREMDVNAFFATGYNAQFGVALQYPGHAFLELVDEKTATEFDATQYTPLEEDYSGKYVEQNNNQPGFLTTLWATISDFFSSLLGNKGDSNKAASETTQTQQEKQKAPTNEKITQNQEIAQWTEKIIEVGPDYETNWQNLSSEIIHQKKHYLLQVLDNLLRDERLSTKAIPDEARDSLIEYAYRWKIKEAQNILDSYLQDWNPKDEGQVWNLFTGLMRNVFVNHTTAAQKNLQYTFQRWFSQFNIYWQRDFLIDLMQYAFEDNSELAKNLFTTYWKLMQPTSTPEKSGQPIVEKQGDSKSVAISGGNLWPNTFTISSEDATKQFEYVRSKLFEYATYRDSKSAQEIYASFLSTGFFNLDSELQEKMFSEIVFNSYENEASPFYKDMIKFLLQEDNFLKLKPAVQAQALLKLIESRRDVELISSALKSYAESKTIANIFPELDEIVDKYNVGIQLRIVDALIDKMDQNEGGPAIESILKSLLKPEIFLKLDAKIQSNVIEDWVTPHHSSDVTDLLDAWLADNFDRLPEPIQMEILLKFSGYDIDYFEPSTTEIIFGKSKNVTITQNNIAMLSELYGENKRGISYWIPNNLISKSSNRQIYLLLVYGAEYKNYRFDLFYEELTKRLKKVGGMKQFLQGVDPNNFLFEEFKKNLIRHGKDIGQNAPVEPQPQGSESIQRGPHPNGTLGSELESPKEIRGPIDQSRSDSKNIRSESIDRALLTEITHNPAFGLISDSGFMERYMRAHNSKGIIYAIPIAAADLKYEMLSVQTQGTLGEKAFKQMLTAHTEITIFNRQAIEALPFDEKLKSKFAEQLLFHENLHRVISDLGARDELTDLLFKDSQYAKDVSAAIAEVTPSDKYFADELIANLYTFIHYPELRSTEDIKMQSVLEKLAVDPRGADFWKKVEKLEIYKKAWEDTKEILTKIEAKNLINDGSSAENLARPSENKVMTTAEIQIPTGKNSEKELTEAAQKWEDTAFIRVLPYAWNPGRVMNKEEFMNTLKERNAVWSMLKPDVRITKEVEQDNIVYNVLFNETDSTYKTKLKNISEKTTAFHGAASVASALEILRHGIYVLPGRASFNEEAFAGADQGFKAVIAFNLPNQEIIINQESGNIAVNFYTKNIGTKLPKSLKDEIPGLRLNASQENLLLNGDAAGVLVHFGPEYIDKEGTLLANEKLLQQKKITEQQYEEIARTLKDQAVTIEKKGGSPNNSGISNGEPRQFAEKKGGIDLNPANIDLDIQGGKANLDLPADLKELEGMQINGFTPVIINIIPITNLPLLLGATEAVPAPAQKLSANEVAILPKS